MKRKRKDNGMETGRKGRMVYEDLRKGWKNFFAIPYVVGSKMLRLFDRVTEWVGRVWYCQRE